MDDASAPDFLTDLPLSIIEIILSLLPLRDAVRTSILSSKWRYRWASVPQLTIDDKCVAFSTDKATVENNLIKFITHFLLLHNGPIHRFKLCTSYLRSCPEIDQWILFLSRNDIRELTVELGEGYWFRVPSCLFSCKKLTHLQLLRCELDPPPTFKGFLCLKTLDLQEVSLASDAIESLISSCPFLESLTLSYFDSFDLCISAPNLKFLCLEGEFREVCIDNSPLLEVIDMFLYMSEDTAELLEQSPSCNLSKFLGRVPLLERLVGRVYFTKYLSIGIDRWKPLTYNNLKVIELYQMNLEDMKEMMVLLRLIINSPNLEELQISGSGNSIAIFEAQDLDFWETECPSDCTIKNLKQVKMTEISGVLHEMELIKFLLANSPTLEFMCITPGVYVADGKLDMLITLLRFRRSSPHAEIVFYQD